MNSNTANLTTDVRRYDSGDETTINPEIVLYIKKPNTPPETEAEEL